MAELMLGQPLFPGESGIDQLVEIIKILGTPSREQIKTMNPNYMEHKFPQIRPHPFAKASPVSCVYPTLVLILFDRCSALAPHPRPSTLCRNCWSTRPQRV